MESRRRRGCDVDVPWRRGRGDAAAATWIFWGDARRDVEIRSRPALERRRNFDGSFKTGLRAASRRRRGSTRHLDGAATRGDRRFGAVAAFVTFWFTLDNWSAAEEELRCIKYGALESCAVCLPNHALKKSEIGGSSAHSSKVAAPCSMV